MKVLILHKSDIPTVLIKNCNRDSLVVLDKNNIKVSTNTVLRTFFSEKRVNEFAVNVKETVDLDRFSTCSFLYCYKN